ncbi:MAG: SDR family oxidoreductase [Pseudomonadota bacterium]
MPNALFIGPGYSARPLAKRLVGEGWTVSGTTRDRAKAMTLAADGITPIVWESPALLPCDPVEAADALIISTGPDGEGCPAASAMSDCQVFSTTRILYLSSSGVYGDTGGAWIDETAPCNPETERGKARLAAEDAWVSLAERFSCMLTLCRLAGIYGPGRSAIDSLSGDTPGARAGLSRRLIKPGQVFNRIHRDDIAAGLYALLHTERPPEIVNFADDTPTPPADPITFAAELLGITPPPEVRFEDIQNELSPMAKSFYAESKRIHNDRLKALPGFVLKYPSYREGLRAILDAKRSEADERRT